MKFFNVVSLNISAEKGVPKKPVKRMVLIKDFGVSGDAHAGSGERQVSLLASEDIDGVNAAGAGVGYGDFAENITTKGIDLVSLTIGTQMKIGEVLLEISRIGKQCHEGCSIMRKTGSCIMPRRGVFAKVIEGGEISCENNGTYGF